MTRQLTADSFAGERSATASGVWRKPLLVLMAVLGVGYIVVGAVVISHGLHGQETIVVKHGATPDAMERNALYWPQVESETRTWLVALGTGSALFGVGNITGAYVIPRRRVYVPQH